VVPNQINDGRVLPRVTVLVEGLELERFGSGGGSLGKQFSDNPAWILLDVLRRSGWLLGEIDLPSFAEAAAFCDETIAATDNQGNPISTPRFRCNVVVRSRRTAADVIRGVRNNARLRLTYQTDGKLAVQVENSLALQQPAKPVGSNAPTMVNGGWPAYVYSDSSDGAVTSGILRRPDNSAAVRLWQRPTADTPNRFSIEFADRFNEYQQDSLALVDSQDITRTGQEITGRLVADGLATFDQAARMLKFFLDKSIHGNRFIEFETSIKALGQRVGDLITVTYAKEGFLNQPFRILKIEPATNYRAVRINAQIHDDAWYQDTNGQLSLIPETRRQPGSEPRVPDPLYGDELDEFGQEQFRITEFQIAGTDGSILTEVEVGFNPPQAGRSLVVGIPIVNFQPSIFATGGSVQGDQTLYYAATANDSDGLESNPSFVIRAKIPAGASTNRVELTGLSFSSGTASFNIYRGSLPTRLFRIASGQTVASVFVDTGISEEMSGAPDPHYDHANFYWRLEDTEEQFASIFDVDSVGSSVLNMPVDGLAGHAVRLFRGKGAGQERTISSNTTTTVFVTPNWETEPDESTVFAVSENTWHFGGRARSSPARFQIPNRQDKVVQITGRSANAQNIESLEGLALVTRWRIGGGGLGVADLGVPPEPSFAVAAPGDGTLDVTAIGFSVLENTQTIRTGTFQLWFRNELAGAGTILLDAAVSDTEATLALSEAGPAQPGDLIQLEGEVMRVTGVEGAGATYLVDRGQGGSTAAAHGAGTIVHQLLLRAVIVPFERSFFGTLAGGSWRHSEPMPCIRLVCAELWLTNAFGQSPTGSNSFAALPDGGLRTLHGGQFSFQVEGLLGIVDDAVPVVSVQEALSIRDAYAFVKEAPSGASLQLRLNQDGNEITTLSIASGQTTSTPINGAGLPALQALANLSLDITAVGTTYPSRDLTVTIRV
jgi:Putative phage tail protein